jgi:2-polyprenyl-6-methoxyphenol hydroxylase-like FAD-dependent oxidoreductase
MAYDVIVVGARVGGASTAMLLARSGLKVLALDQARFPSDTLSSHQLQVPAVARLARWGLLDRLLASGVPPTRTVRFDTDGTVLQGRYPVVDGIDFMLSPRRRILDTMLVEAAREAGAEVREGSTVKGLLVDGGTVTGVEFRSKDSGSTFREHAAVVVGADGHRSLVARQVRAAEYRSRPARSLAFYTYWQNLPVDGGEMYSLDRRVASAWPTNDGLVMTYVAWPVDEFDTFRRDPAANLLATLDHAGTLGDRARQAVAVEPIRGTTDLPNVMRTPTGPGWVLVGDAGLAMDPITGLGMGHAMRDAELAAALIVAGGARHGGNGSIAYARTRDKEATPIYDFTVGLAALEPTTSARRDLFRAIADSPDRTTNFFGTLNGSLPLARLFSPANLIRLVGLRGFMRLARSRPR